MSEISYSLQTGEILTISDLNHTARLLLEKNIGLVWVQGEISNLSIPSSGHWYFSLKDNQAQIRCAMFANKNRSSSVQAKNGIQVLALAQVSLYEARGEFQLIVEELQAIGVGNLQFELEKLSRKLAAEGFFDSKNKKPLPFSPRCIGVITSPTGAALQDILNVLKRRTPSTSVIIYPCSVQGAQAAGEIVQALEYAKKRAECDLLIIARGGGSLEDLWPFNEEIVARAIFSHNIPIISGVGHETDFTICDWVADMRAPTPSAAAEMSAPDQKNLQVQLKHAQERLIHIINQKIFTYQKELLYLKERLPHPIEYIQQIKQKLDFYEIQLIQIIQNKIEQIKQNLLANENLLKNLNPINILNRGYCLAMKDKKIFTSATEIPLNENFHLYFSDGKIEVESVNKTGEQLISYDK